MTRTDPTTVRGLFAHDHRDGSETVLRMVEDLPAVDLGPGVACYFQDETTTLRNARQETLVMIDVEHVFVRALAPGAVLVTLVPAAHEEDAQDPIHIPWERFSRLEAVELDRAKLEAP